MIVMFSREQSIGQLEDAQSVRWIGNQENILLN
jgi:hypothetical protein